MPRYFINISFPERVIVEDIPRNVIIDRGAAIVDNNISRDDIFDYYPLMEFNIYFYSEQNIKTLIYCRFLSYAYMYHGEGSSKGKIMHSLLIIYA